jgi:hypothetical protein
MSDPDRDPLFKVIGFETVKTDRIRQHCVPALSRTSLNTINFNKKLLTLFITGTGIHFFRAPLEC